MIRQVFVLLLLAGLLAIEVNSIKIKNLETNISKRNPRDLMDDAKERLEELKETVEEAITTARNDLESLGLYVLTFGDNLLQAGQLQIVQYNETVLQRLSAIKDIGNNAGVDISSCMGNAEEELFNILPTEYANQMTYCIGNTTQEYVTMVQDATYFVDIYINRVNDLEFQLSRCSIDSALCISPIVTQIELGMVQLPQDIQVEVDLAQGLLDNVKTSIQSCAILRVSDYIVDASSILNDLWRCVNALIP